MKAKYISLGNVIKQHPVIAGITAAVAAIGIITAIIDQNTLSVKEAREQLDKLNSEIDEIHNTFSSTEKTVSGISKRFAELSQGVDQISGKNLTLNTEDYQEFLDLSNQLADLFPTLSRNYDENGNAIVQLSGDVDTIVGSLTNLIDAQRQLSNQEIAEKLPDTYKATRKSTQGYEDEIEVLEKQRDLYKRVLEDLHNLSSWEDIEDSQGKVKPEYYFLREKISHDGKNNLINNGSVQDAVRYYEQQLASANTSLVTTTNKYKQEWSKLNQSLFAWLYTDANYSVLSDNLQAGIQSVINTIDWNDFDFENVDDVKNHILENIIEPIRDNQEVHDLFVKLFELQPGDLDRVDIARQLQNILNDLDIEFNVMPVVANENEVRTRLSNSIAAISGTARTTNTGEYMMSQLEVGMMEEYTKDFTAAQVDLWLEVTEGATSAKEAIEEYEKATAKAAEYNTYVISDEEVEAIEKYKSTVSSVQDILEKLRDVSPESKPVLVDDLLTAFDDSGLDMDHLLVDAVARGGEVTEADMMAIADAAWHALAGAMDDSSEAYAIIEAIRDKYADFDFAGAIDINKSAYDELYDLYNKIQNGETFTQDEIQPFLDKYEDLQGELVKVGDEYSLQEDALVSLIDKYGELTNAAITSEIARIKTAQEVNAYIGMSEEELTDAMEGATTETLAMIEEALAFIGVYGEDYVVSLNDLLNKILDDANKRRDVSEFSEEIDWAARSVEVLEDNLSDLERTFDNAKGYDAQKEAIKGVIGALEDLQEGYRQSKIMYTSMYNSALNSGTIKKLGWTSLVQGMVESGEEFSVLPFESLNIPEEDKEKLYDEIQEVIDLWNKKNDASDNYIQIGIDIDAKKLEDLQLDADKFSSIRENLETELGGAISDARRKEILEDPNGLKKAINDEYNALIKVAQAEKDVYEVAKLELERKQALADVDQQRLDLIREIDDAEISRLERNRTEIQNQIDLNGGKGTAEQYSKLISIEKSISSERSKDLERETKLLLEIKKTNGDNSSEYREQEKIVNDIADDIAECEKNTKDWGQELLNLPIEAINDAIDGLNKKLDANQSAQEEVDSIIAGAVAYIQDEIDAQEELKQGIQDQIDALQEANDERERTLALEKAKYELERAQSQRTVKVYKGEGKGFVYEQDQEAVRNAQENLSNLEFEETIHALEKQMEYYDDIIADLQEMQDAWSNIRSDAEDYLNIEKAIEAIGVEGIFDTAKVEEYSQAMRGLLQTEQQINEELKTWQAFLAEVEEISSKYTYKVFTLEEAINAVKGAGDEYLPQLQEFQKLNEDGAYVADPEKVSTVIDEIMRTYLDGYSELVDGAEGAGDDAEDAMSEVVKAAMDDNDLIEDDAKKTNDAIETDAGNTIGAITTKLQDELKIQKGHLETFKSDVLTIFGDSYNDVKEGLLDALNAFSEAVSDSCSTLEEQITDIEKKLTDTEEALDDLSEKEDKIFVADKGGGSAENSMIQLQAYHTGLEKGLVGEKDAGEGLKKVALRKLEPDEIPALLKLDEAVLTQLQQHNVMSNIGTAFKAGINTAVIKNNSSTPVVQNISLTLPNVTNESGYNRLVQELQGLQLDALQFAKKR